MQYVERQMPICQVLTSFDRRGREGAISVKKIKSNLLASVIVLTTIPPTMKIGRAVLERACFLISSKLGDTGDVRTPPSFSPKPHPA